MIPTSPYDLLFKMIFSTSSEQTNAIPHFEGVKNHVVKNLIIQKIANKTQEN